MPRARDLSAYPTTYYWGVVEKVEREGATLFPCTRQQAVTIQGEFYAWRRVCEKREGEARGLGVEPARLRNVALRSTEEGLWAIPESETLGPKVLGAVLGDLGLRKGPMVVADLAQSALADLQARLGRAPE